MRGKRIAPCSDCEAETKIVTTTFVPGAGLACQAEARVEVTPRAKVGPRMPIGQGILSPLYLATKAVGRSRASNRASTPNLSALLYSGEGQLLDSACVENCGPSIAK